MSAPAPPARVDEPRPRSAWLLVCVACATLWITEQLAAWVIAIQVAALCVSYWRRLEPFAWQSSPLMLNAAMFGITAATISVALQGRASTVSLAHFVALTQMLQLVDVRPRKSEFLLVTLALFQVVLAANLTDSVLFPPLLGVFTASATWTLLVHTLRTEAIAAGDGARADAALSPSLARTTVLASLLSIALAFVFFLSLPRLRASMLTGGVGGSQAVAGFSDEIELGAIGRIRQDERVVLRIETLEGEPPAARDAYWRGLAFDRFDGRRWSISLPEGTRGYRQFPTAPRIGVELDGGGGEATLVQRIIREPVASGVVFASGAPRRVRGAINRIERDVNGGLYVPSQVEERVRYTVWTLPTPRDDAALTADAAALPPIADVPRGRPDERYLALPALDRRVASLAREITRAASSDAERAAAIETHLRRAGRYTDAPPDYEAGDLTPIEGFLLEGLEGHCEYFASSMVVLARSVGLPARLVNGFAGGRLNPVGGFVSVTRSDAHAWVELHYADAGWVRYDPTPPDLRMRAAASGSLLERLAEVGSAVELWWFERVVDFDSSDQVAALRGAFGAWRSFRSATATPAGRKRSAHDLREWLAETRARWPIALAGIGALFAAAAIATSLRSRERSPVPAGYARALRLLARRGFVRRPGSAARDFAREIAPALPPDAAACFRGITEGYLAARFGGHDQAAALAPRRLQDFERYLKGGARR